MATDVSRPASSAPDRTAATAAEQIAELIAVQLADSGTVRTVYLTAEALLRALHRQDGDIDRTSAAETPQQTHLPSIFLELGVTTLTDRQRLTLAQELIGTVTEHQDSARDRVRGAGLESILDAFELLDSRAVAGILAPTGRPVRSVAQKRRKAGELIGLPVGRRPDYRYPDFQFDRPRHRIHPLVAYANRYLDVDSDPYGAASWWLTPTDILDGRSPLDDLMAGDLTEVAIDNMLTAARQGM